MSHYPQIMYWLHLMLIHVCPVRWEVGGRSIWNRYFTIELALSQKLLFICNYRFKTLFHDQSFARDLLLYGPVHAKLTLCSVVLNSSNFILLRSGWECTVWHIISPVKASILFRCFCSNGPVVFIFYILCYLPLFLLIVLLRFKWTLHNIPIWWVYDIDSSFIFCVWYKWHAILTSFSYTTCWCVFFESSGWRDFAPLSSCKVADWFCFCHPCQVRPSISICIWILGILLDLLIVVG